MSDATTSGVRLETFQPHHRYRTPEAEPTDTLCRLSRIPNDIRLLAALDEVIGLLTNPDAWDDSAGGLSSTLAAALAGEVYLWSDCMIGVLMPYASQSTPPNMLPCNGRSYARVDYPKLYDRLHPTFILDADTFQVPDLRHRVVMGAGGATPEFPPHPFGTTGGEWQHTLTVAEMPSHNHTTQPHQHGEVTAVPAVINGGLEAPASAAVPGAAQTTASAVQVNDRGGGNPHNNLPPYLALRWGIVAE